jgi:hypothetical protein
VSAEPESRDAGGLAALGALAKLPGGVSGALENLRSIAEGMRILPELARILAAIDKTVESLDREVMKMRRSVDQLHGEVDALGDRMEPHLVEMQRSLQPLKRVTGRMGFRRRRTDNESSEESDSE